MKTTQDEFQKFFKKLLFSEAENEDELGYKDPFVTKEQIKRDKHVTELLNEYVSFYKSKVKHSKICRYIILVPCVGIIIAFAILLIILSYRVVGIADAMTIKNLVAFITACLSFISLIIGLLTIITKYFFPENDEQYITTIVESIQRNDLDNKRENARYKQDSVKELTEKKME